MTHLVLHVELPPVDQRCQALGLQTGQVIREIPLEVACVMCTIVGKEEASFLASKLEFEENYKIFLEIVEKSL